MEYFRGEIKERLGISVFSGETQENFMQGMVHDGKNIFYDKTKLPFPARPELYVDRVSMWFPFERALIKSKELGHSPLIIQGNLSRFSPHTKKNNEWIEFPKGYLLPVNFVWLPKNDTSWRKLDPFNVNIDIPSIMERVPVQEFLKDMDIHSKLNSSIVG